MLQNPDPLSRRMRSLAIEIEPRGLHFLVASGDVRSRMKDAALEAARLSRPGANGAFARAGDMLRQMQDLLPRDRGARVPSVNGVPRSLLFARALVDNGDESLSRESLLLACRAFDGAKSLPMDELWSIPRALSIALLEAFVRLCEAVFAIERDKRLAEECVRRGRLPRRESPALLERAMRLAAESEDKALLRKIEDRLARADDTPASCAARAHAEDALLTLRLDNLASTRRMLQSLDWEKEFPALSRTEQVLLQDPSGLYGQLDAPSRAVVRREVASVARSLMTGETLIARRAADAAEKRDEADPGRYLPWWFTTDEGRRALLLQAGVSGNPLPLLTPDPKGRILLWSTALLSALVLAVYQACTGFFWILPMGIPLSWVAARAILCAVYPRLTRPRSFLRLETLPEDATCLLALPVLLTSPARAEEAVRELETLGCLDPRGLYLLLGDFRDGKREREADDGAILDAARREIDSLNRAAGREKYFFLCRPRIFYPPDGKWMGRERKRGALMDLNALLLQKDGAEQAFSAENRAAGALSRAGIRYVMTVDSGTRLLPGTMSRLARTAEVPFNRIHTFSGILRGYAVFQPAVEQAPGSAKNRFARLFGGEGGVNTYPAPSPDAYQDLTGRGIYSGKALYDVAAFDEALRGRLPDGRILSHDLLEGMIARAALVSDTMIFDGFPSTVSGYARRLNRWTRGDWQLLGFLFSRKRIGRGGARLGCVDRMMLLDNLLRSLAPASVMGLLFHSSWFGLPGGFWFAGAFQFLPAILSFLTSFRADLARALGEALLLPVTAASQADAVVRTLWRLLFSKKHLLDWVTAHDAESADSSPFRACYTASILLLPGVFRVELLPVLLVLAGAFAVAPEYLKHLELAPGAPESLLSRRQIAVFTALARDTWRFFESCVTPETHFLPPDNVQIDPPLGAASRTSPTNIGLYLVSCAAAHELGFITMDEFASRASGTLDTLERLETWHGLPYNWYSVDTLLVLPPRYVSSVDSGNLAASLLLTASFLAESEPALALRAESAAREMDFSALYDEEKDLFRIGINPERDAGSSHYDLLASESRILSFTAIALGRIPIRHWRKLGRPGVRTRDGASLLSWSGTMFEFLMPAIFLRAPEGTLLRASERAMVAEQIAAGRRSGRPWGVSESGYAAFDIHLNYQYHAFGLSRLSLSGPSREDVIAPYASALAASVDPASAADNLSRLSDMGMWGKFGPYEALDGGEHSVVKSWMSHHQGMALAASCNVLTGDALPRAFMSRPESRAASLLLEEKPFLRSRLPARPRVRTAVSARECGAGARIARPDRYADTHLLSGAGSLAVATVRGIDSYSRHGQYACRVAEDLLTGQPGVGFFVRVDGEDADFFTRAKAVWKCGSACYRAEKDEVLLELTFAVSPETGELLASFSCENQSAAPRVIRAAEALHTSLTDLPAMRSHPAFSGLFCVCESPRPGCILTRMTRGEGLSLLHRVFGGERQASETEWPRFSGRTERHRLTGVALHPIDPCSAVETELHLLPGESGEVTFSLLLASDEEISAAMDAPCPSVGRAASLASIQEQSLEGFFGTDGALSALADRAACLLLDPHMATKRGEGDPFSREPLWQIGLSGALPILVIRAKDEMGIACARDALHAHAFWKMHGVQSDLVLIAMGESGYARPIRDALANQVALSHLSAEMDRSGGAYLLDGEMLTGEQSAALDRICALSAEEDFRAALRRALSPLTIPDAKTLSPFPAGRPLTKLDLDFDNGYGGVTRNGEEYVVYSTPPAAWCNVTAGDRAGAILSERGGGCAWCGSSRFGRLIPFSNDPMAEGFGLRLTCRDEGRALASSLLPGRGSLSPLRARFRPECTIYEGENACFSHRVTVFPCPNRSELRIRVSLSSRENQPQDLAFTLACDWLAGGDAGDLRGLTTWKKENACFAAGAMPGVGYLAALGAHAGANRASSLLSDDPRGDGGYAISVRARLNPGGKVEIEFALGAEEDRDAALLRAREMTAFPDDALELAQREWQSVSGSLAIHTPDPALDRMFNRFLPQQVLAGRIRARTGLYQPGGAFGFRDQLQDMLSMIPRDPGMVRRHILLSAARQFEDGDVMHWWHPPATGVRTRISDDRLFLPYIAAIYARETGDAGIFEEEAPYLKNVPIPDGKEDFYGQAEETDYAQPLYDHCMRAFRATRFGRHDLAKIGGGDWNDGMNRVGSGDEGESVWLSEFLSVCASSFKEFARTEEDAAYLAALSARMNETVEREAWDGDRFLRAFYDDGSPLGGRGHEECAIDAISQAWAVFAGLERGMCEKAVDSAWRELADPELGILKLLTPPFTGGSDPGYIASYPPGVRENGAQYTHAAVWLLMAMIQLGDTRSHRLLSMLLPLNHALTKADADRYRAEPYVLAGDVYSHPEHPGMGGWSWYTGAASWLSRAVLALFGYERRGDRVRIAPLLGEWKEASLTVSCGAARYRISSRPGASPTLDGAPIADEWLTLIDDGRDHAATFPPRGE